MWEDELKKKLENLRLQPYHNFFVDYIKSLLKQQREICASQIEDEPSDEELQYTIEAIRELVLNAPEPKKEK